MEVEDKDSKNDAQPKAKSAEPEGSSQILPLSSQKDSPDIVKRRGD